MTIALRALLATTAVVLASSAFAGWTGPTYSGGQYMTWTSGPWPYLSGANGYGGGGSAASGQITATFTWQGGGTPPDTVYVLESCKASANSDMNNPAPSADNGLDNPTQTTVTWLNPFYYQVTARSEGKRITAKWIGGATTFQIQASPSASGQLGCSVGYSATITDRRLDLSRADGGQWTQTGPSTYEAHTTYSGMASLVDLYSDPNYSEKNIQGVVTKAIGSWDISGFGLGVSFNWLAYLSDQPTEGSEKYFDQLSPFEITDNNFLPYGESEAWQKATSVKATDHSDGATASATSKWIIHKQVEQWSETSETQAQQVLSYISPEGLLTTPSDSISASGEHSVYVEVSTIWSIDASLGITVPILTGKSFGDASIGASYGQSRTLGDATSTGWSITLALGQRPPGRYRIAWVITKTQHNGTATYWNRIGQSQTMIPHTWTPVDEVAGPSIALVWVGPI